MTHHRASLGIIFAASSVLGIGKGTKTQTRRLDRDQRPYQAGDVLWVRETWGLHAYGDETDWFVGSIHGVSSDSLRAQYQIALRADWGPNQEGCFWRPSLFMPRWASRYTLEVTAVRRQLLQEISEEDARAEGCSSDMDALRSLTHLRGGDACRAVPSQMRSARDEYAALWDTINGKRAPWAANPRVYAYTFRVLRADAPTPAI